VVYVTRLRDEDHNLAWVASGWRMGDGPSACLGTRNSRLCLVHEIVVACGGETVQPIDLTDLLYQVDC